MIVTGWEEKATSAFHEQDSWKSGAYAHPTRVYGKYHSWILTCAEQGITWANSAVPYLYGIQSAGTAILLQCNHPYRPLTVNVVIASLVMHSPFEAGQNIRKFTVDFREYITST